MQIQFVCLEKIERKTPQGLKASSGKFQRCTFRVARREMDLNEAAITRYKDKMSSVFSSEVQQHGAAG